MLLALYNVSYKIGAIKYMVDYQQPEVTVEYENNFRYHLVRTELDEYGDVRWGEDWIQGTQDYLGWIGQQSLTVDRGVLVTEISLFTTSVISIKHPDAFKMIDSETGELVPAVEQVRGKSLYTAEPVFLAAVDEAGKNDYRTAQEILAQDRIPDLMVRWLSLCAKSNRWDGDSYDKFVEKIPGVNGRRDLARTQGYW